MSEFQFDEEQTKILDRVEKLLRLAARNPSEEEAAAAAAKAQELLAAYNLDMSMVNADHDKSAVREKMKIQGGMYEFQRDLWRAVCGLNFCLYWHMMDRKWKTVNKVDQWTGQKYAKRVLGKTFQHYVVGRVVNTRSSRMMAEYLIQCIERLVSERYDVSQRWMREAVALREGIADTLVNRLYARREQMEEEERAKRAAEAVRPGSSTRQALTLAGLAEQERDANMDVLYGEGWSARQAAQRAERARLAKEAEEEYTRWAAANPEEARKEEEKRRKEAEKSATKRKRRVSYATSERDKRSWESSYWQGRELGEKVSIDQQVDDRPAGAPLRIGRR